MKSYNNLFDRIVDPDNLKLAIMEASKGKRKQSEVKYVLNHIDYHVNRLHNLLITNTYKPRMKSSVEMPDGNKRKMRKINKPVFMYDQIVHHALIQVISPIILQGKYANAYGSLPTDYSLNNSTPFFSRTKPGLHMGSKLVRRWLDHQPKKTRYCLKMDIRHFYESIDKKILKSKLANQIRDKRALSLINLIIDSYTEPGLPLGYYTSQWFAMYYLKKLDHFIKEDLHAKFYVRYADDMVIFGSNKRVLHHMRKIISDYLRIKLHLRMKYNYQVFKIEYQDKHEKLHGRKLDFLGFQFNHQIIILRKSIMLRFSKTARRINKIPYRKLTISDCASLLCRKGYWKIADCNNFMKSRITNLVNFKRLKRKLSSIQRRMNHANSKLAAA